MKKFWKLKLFLFLLLFMGSACVNRQESSADTIYGKDSLGKYQTTTSTSEGTITESVVGVRVRLKQPSGYDVITYGVDTWKKKQNGAWKYVGSEVEGKQGQFGDYSPTSSITYLFTYPIPRFSIVVGLTKRIIFNSVSDEYSVVTTKYSGGKMVDQYAEYSFQSQTELSQRENSYLYELRGSGNTIQVGSYDADGTSYDYTVYPAINFRQGEDVTADTGECSIRMSGTAYFDGSKYYIEKLPTVRAPEGYTLTIDGWYDAKQGGTKYVEGSRISPYKTLYLRYSMEVSQCTVQCKDVVGSQNGLQLGSSKWTQEYGTTATGAHEGAIPLPDTYYPGMYYTGCTTAVVNQDEVTVYRFFDYASYPVTVIDMVNSGIQTEKTLGITQKEGMYQQIVAGGTLLGSDTTEGKYYTGYVYSGQSSARVEIGGITVYRYFVPVKYTICFDGNGATRGEMEPLKGCEYGIKYSLSPNAYENLIHVTFDLQSEDAVFGMGNIQLKREFSGWSKTPGGSVAYNDRAEVQNVSEVSGETKLYAKWEEALFVSDGEPKRMGYQFAGWSERPDAEQGNTVVRLTGDTTLFAIWKPDITEYHVEYYKESLDGLFEKAASYTFNDYSGKKITLENIEQLYPGYYIDMDSSTLSGNVRGDGSLILTVYYRRNTYTVTFDLEGGTVKQDYPLFSGVYESSFEIPKEMPQKEHCEFMGWTADKGSKQIYCRPGDVYHIPNHNQTLYAVWKQDTYRIHYMADSSSEEVLIRQEYDFDEEITLPECNAVKRGYQFVGWKLCADDSVCYPAGEVVESRFETKDGVVRFYAAWKPVSGTVVFRKNAPEDEDESAIMGTVSPIKYEYDAPCMLSEKTYFLVGYDFLGWNTEPDGSGESFAAGMSIQNVFESDGENNLYAMWTPSKDTKFFLLLYKEALSGEEPEEEVFQLKGETNQTVRNAVLNFYQRDSIEDVFEGFHVDNPEAMDAKVRADGFTIVKLYLSRREYTVTVAEDFETNSYYSQVHCRYEDSIVPEEELEEVGAVARYIDGDGNAYVPGEAIHIYKDLTLVPQHKVCYQLDDKPVKEQYVNHNAYETAYQPKETAYRFDGWYDRNSGERYCSAGERIRIGQDMTLSGKWTKEKITYHIRYEMGSYDGVAALEKFTDTYQYGDSVLLPTKAQIFIPEKYQFVGWYEQGDSRRTIVSRIPAEAYGDKMYCLLLEEKEIPGNTPEPSDALLPSESPETPDSSGDGTVEDVSSQGGKNDDNISDKNLEANTENPNEQHQGIETPIHNTVKQGDGDTQKKVTKNKKFTKKKIRYQIISTSKKQVAVVGANRKLQRVTIPAKVTWNHKSYKVTKIGNKAFYAHPSLRKITIGGQVKTIGKLAFAKTKKLKKVVLGKKVTTIKEKAFYKSKSLKKVIIKGKKVKKVGKKAFGKLKKGVRISVPSSCEKKYHRLWKRSGVKAK